MGSRLGDTIHLLKLLTTGALGSAIVLALGGAQDMEMPPACSASGRLTS